MGVKGRRPNSTSKKRVRDQKQIMTREIIGSNYTSSARGNYAWEAWEGKLWYGTETDLANGLDLTERSSGLRRTTWYFPVVRCILRSFVSITGQMNGHRSPKRFKRLNLPDHASFKRNGATG